MGNKKNLTSKQFEFLKLVLKGENQTEAYKKIYKTSSHKMAIKNASLLINREDIKQIIQEEREKLLDEIREEAKLLIINEYNKLAYSDISDLLQYDSNGVKFYDSKTVDTRVVKNVKCTKKIIQKKGGDTEEQIEMQLQLHDKLKGLEGLAKMLGLVIDKKELTGKDGEPIKIIIPEVAKKW